MLTVYFLKNLVRQGNLWFDFSFSFLSIDFLFIAGFLNIFFLFSIIINRVLFLYQISFKNLFLQFSKLFLLDWFIIWLWNHILLDILVHHLFL